MKPKNRNFRPSLFRSATLTAFMVGSLAGLDGLQAANITWTGGGVGSTNLGLASNWSTGAVPSAVVPDVAVWDGTVAGSLSLVYTTTTLGGAAGNIGINLSLTSGQTSPLNLDSGAVTSAIRVNNVTLDAGSGEFSLGNSQNLFNLTLGGAPTQTHTWTNSSSNPAIIASDVRFGLGGGGNHALAFSGSGKWTVAALLTPSNTANLSLQKLGAGELTLSGGGSFSNVAATNAPIITAFGGAFAATLKEGTTRITTGSYAFNNLETVVGGLDTVGTNTQLIMDGGAMTGISWFSIGRGNGTGLTSSDVTLNNAASISSTNMSGGFNADNATTAPKGVITLNNTSSIAVANTVNIAESINSNITINVNGTSTFRQTANASQTRIGIANGSIGTINVNGGTASFERDLVVGYAGTGSGKIVINSGVVNVASTVERWLKVNELNGSAGQIEVNGGTLNLNTNTDIRFGVSAAATGTSSLTINGGIVRGHTGNVNNIASLGSVVDMNQAATGAVNNTVNLNGGALLIGQVISTSSGGTRTFNFNGGTLRASANTTAFVTLGTGTARANVRNGGAIIDSNGFDITVAQALLNSNIPEDNLIDGGLTKSGAGTLTLGGSNTYTGPTTITGGTLAVTASNNVGSSNGITVNGTGARLLLSTGVNVASTTPVTITSGGVNGTGTIHTATVANNASNSISAGNGNIGDLTVGNLAFQGAAEINLRANGQSMDQMLRVTSSLATQSAGKITVNLTNTTGVWSSNASGFDYTLIDYSGGTFTGSASDFEVGTVPGLNSNQVASIVDTGSAIVLRVTGEPLIWSGSVSGDWNSSQNNWSYLGGPTQFSAGSPVLFDDTAGVFAINLTSNVAPGAVIFDSLTPYTISSTGNFGISGAASVVVKGGGEVEFSTNNTYTGATGIVEGVLKVTGNGSIASSSINLGTLGRLVLNPGAAATYANPITGTGRANGAVIKEGTSALTLSGANTFTGDLILDGGRLNLNSPTALGDVNGNFVLNGGSLDNTSGALNTMTPFKAQRWNADVTFIGSHSLNMSNGAVTLTGSRSVDVQANTLYVGAVGDGAQGYSLTKTGTGTLVMNGGNITGNLDVQAGIVGINQDLLSAAPIGSGILQNAGNVGTKWAYLTVNDDTTSNLLIRNNDGSNTMQLGIVKRGTGTLTLTNPANVATSNLGVDNGRLVLMGGGTYGARNDNGTTNTASTSIVSNATGNNAVLEIDGATVNYNNRSTAGTEAFRGSLTAGFATGSAGAIRLTSGSLTTNMQLALGWTGTAYGAMTQTGGSTTVGGFLALGVGSSRGVLNISGGTVTHNGPLTSAGGTGSLGMMNLGGNAIYNCNNTSPFAFMVGEGGVGTINVSDSAALTLASTGSGITLGQLAAGNGTLNLLGGTVTTKSIVKGAGSGVLNFNGGRLVANAASTSFLTGLTAAYVRSGGGVIDNGGNAITLGQPLLAPFGNGVSASGLTVSGGGYIGSPLVTITGDGTGATAVANIDASGNLTGITITNPGNGYTTPPTFALVGGGTNATGAIDGTATLFPTVGGGMSFSGSAVTTVNGMNTYIGNTTVNSGSTLLVGSAGAVTVKPAANGSSSKISGAGTVSIDGALRIDLTGATVANGNSWTLVDVATKIYHPITFKVTSATLGDFTALPDGVTHTLVEGDNTWSFSETTGQLSLSVASAVVGYDAWIGEFGLANDKKGLSDDPDLDGLSNMVEYALGRNPGISDGAASSAAKDGSALVLTFNRSDLAASTGDVSILISYGSDLVGWTDVTVPATNATVGGVAFNITDGSPNDTVTASIPHDGAAKFFARVKVVK